MAVVNLSSMPKPATVRTFRFPALNGGINLRDAEINLKDNESPEIVNLWWEDGVLQSRPGQVWLSPDASATGFAASPEPFYDRTFFHIGDALRYADCRDQSGGELTLHELLSGVPENRGAFVRFGDYLFYKNRGGFFRISYEGGAFFAVSMTDTETFTPTILINADPASGSGDAYQPENRLSPKKRVSYNAATFPKTVVKTADGVSRIFLMDKTRAADNLQGVRSVYIDDAFLESALYTVDAITGSVIFNAAPKKDAVITFTLDIGRIEYHLPVFPVDAVTEVKVDGILWNPGQDYTVDAPAGVVTFTTAPQVTNPPTNNTVEIVYSKANPDALSAVMDCPYMASYGSGTQLCLVAGGCSAQPNGVYWTGSTQYGLDPSYWPVLNYNLVGDTVDSVTGFGKQYDQLIVFKGRSIGKLNMEMESVNGRDTFSLTYENVNPRIGCDLPYSIQTIENNLAFATTGGGTDAGIYMILSASAAYENNIVRLSRKIDGSAERPGLLYDLRVAGRAPVFSHDDGKRYYLSVNDRVWLWDYSISDASDPVWFRFTGFSDAAWFQAHGATYHLNAAGRVTRFAPGVFSDYGEGFLKRYRFPARNFGSYDRLKDALTVIFSTRKDTPSNTEITYQTDYEARKDRVNLVTEGYDRLSERDLSARDLSAPLTFAAFRREPTLRHIRHLSMSLESDEAGKDLTILSAEIQYRFTGRDR